MECSAEPACPSGMNTTRVCRRPCTGGGYFFQFGSHCMDGTEPVNGGCITFTNSEGRRETLFSTGGGTAIMDPGARRPGEEFHGHSFSIEWNCPVNPPIAGATGTGRRTFEFRYERKPWGRGSYRMEDARLQSAAWHSFISGLDVNRTDYRTCLEEARRGIWTGFESACKVVERAAGLQPDRAETSCKGEQRDRYAGPIRAGINSKIIATVQGGGARARILPMSPALPGQASDISTMNSFMSDCRANPRYVQPFYQDALLTREFMEDRLPGVIQATTAQCRQDLLDFYLDRLADLQPPACRTNGSAPGCEETRLSTNAALAALSRAYNGAVNVRGARLFNYRDAIGACVVDSADPAAKIRDLQLASRLAGQCTDLRFANPRESAIIDVLDTGTGLDAKYRLTRTGDKAYRVDLRLAFTPASEQGPRTERVNRCLRGANPNLKGPGGQTLELALTNDASVPGNPIRIVGEDARSTSAAWESDIDCPTVLHELMHLLGLVDEYRETASGHIYNTRTGVVEGADERPERMVAGTQFFVEYDCRVRGPDNSLMSHQDDAYSANRGFLGTNWGRDRESLLYPAHFSAITHPGCFARNRTYYRCSRSAYQTSVGRHGRGCDTGLPAECRNGDAWLQGNP